MKNEKQYTLFYKNGKTQIITGKNIEDACQKAFNETICPLDAVWKGGDCRNEYVFDRKNYIWVKI